VFSSLANDGEMGAPEAGSGYPDQGFGSGSGWLCQPLPNWWVG